MCFSSWYSFGPCVCTLFYFLLFFVLQTPNINTNRLDEADDQYHRRLFMYDQVTGVSEVGAAPEIVRYADYIEIETMIVENDVDKMHVPVISVHYTERTMGAAGLSGPMKTAMLEFKGKPGLWCARMRNDDGRRRSLSLRYFPLCSSQQLTSTFFFPHESTTTTLFHSVQSFTPKTWTTFGRPVWACSSCA